MLNVKSGDGSCRLRDSAVLILARGGGLPFGVTPA